MTQTYRKWLDRKTCLISSDEQCRFGYEVIITKYTLADFVNRCGGEYEGFPAHILKAVAENGRGCFYEASAHDGARSEYFPSYRAAREYAESQFC